MSAMHSLARAAPAQQLAGKVEIFALLRIATRSLQHFHGQVLAHPSVAPLLMGEHTDLVTIVELWNAAQRKQQQQGLLVACHVLRLFLVGLETARIVVVEEGEQVIGIGIDEVARQIVVEFHQSGIIIGALFVHHRVEQVHQREVHHAAQLAVQFREFRILLPVGNARCTVDPSLSYNHKAGIFAFERQIPVAHHLLVTIRIGVLSDAVDLGIFHPPDTALDEIVLHERIALVPVGHIVGEPSVGSVLQVPLAGVRITDRCGAMCTGLEGGVEVEPILGRQVLEEEVVHSAMVEHQVHHHLDAAFVAILHQLAIILIAAQSRIDLIVVGDGIAVIRTPHIVFLYWRRPDGSDAQFIKIIQRHTNACKVATMTAEVISCFPIDLGFYHSRHIVQFRIAIDETVGHQQVYHILGAKRYNSLTRTLLQFEGLGEVSFLLSRLGESKIESL